MNNQCEGIILHQREYKDNDIILTVLSKEYGKISFVARGIKKASSKNASSCTPFTKSIFYFNYRETSDLQSLKTAERIQMYRHIYDDLRKQVIASIICEMCMKIDCEQHAYLYELLQLCLSYLDVGNNDYGVFAFFTAKMNEVAGVNPDVDGCVHCGNDHNIAGISIYDGGFICANCFDVSKHQHISIDRLRFFRLFHKAKINDYPILESLKMYSYQDVEPIITMFIEYSGIHLTGMKLLREIITFEPIE